MSFFNKNFYIFQIVAVVMIIVSLTQEDNLDHRLGISIKVYILFIMGITISKRLFTKENEGNK